MREKFFPWTVPNIAVCNLFEAANPPSNVNNDENITVIAEAAPNPP